MSSDPNNPDGNNQGPEENLWEILGFPADSTERIAIALGLKDDPNQPAQTSQINEPSLLTRLAISAGFKDDPNQPAQPTPAQPVQLVQPTPAPAPAPAPRQGGPENQGRRDFMLGSLTLGLAGGVIGGVIGSGLMRGKPSRTTGHQHTPPQIAAPAPTPIPALAEPEARTRPRRRSEDVLERLLEDVSIPMNLKQKMIEGTVRITTNQNNALAGFFVAKDIIVTCNHGFDEGEYISGLLTKTIDYSRQHSTEYIWSLNRAAGNHPVVVRDPKRDLAVIVLPRALNVDQRRLFRISTRLKQEDDYAVLCGHPFGKKWVVSAGVLDGYDDRDPSPDKSEFRFAYRYVCPSEPGNSGGPIADMSGVVHAILIQAQFRTTNKISYGAPLFLASVNPMIELGRKLIAQRRANQGYGSDLQYHAFVDSYPNFRELHRRVAVDPSP